MRKVKLPKPTKHGSINRGQLRKLVEQDLIEAKCDYRYTDDYAFDASNNFGKSEYLPAITGPRNYQNGFILFSDHDFSSKSGKAWLNKDGTYTLKVHSNESWILRIKEQK